MTTKFEYKIIMTTGLEDQTLDKAGEEGWELVAVVPSPGYKQFYFKRRPPPYQDPWAKIGNHWLRA